MFSMFCMSVCVSMFSMSVCVFYVLYECVCFLCFV